jgi:hypothetical protein
MRWIIIIVFFLFTLFVSSCSKQINSIKNIFNKESRVKDRSISSIEEPTLVLDTFYSDQKIILGSSPPISDKVIIVEEKHKGDLIIREDPKKVTINADILEKKKWTEGRVIYQIPFKMKVGSQYIVFLRISRNSKRVEILNGLSGEVISSVIPTSNTMSVELIDPSNSDRKIFHITPVNSNTQSVLEGISFTEWTWTVTPIRSGTSNLKIIVKIVENNTPIEKVYSQEVKVKVNPSLQIWMFIEKWWMWIITTILIPSISWYVKNKWVK